MIVNTLARCRPALPSLDDPVLHLNRPEMLPPVGCWLLVKYQDELTYARRTSHVQKHGRQMDYQLCDGTLITDRLEWAPP